MVDFINICMPGFVYLWKNKINGRRYLGSHRGSVDDGYVGSGIAFRKAIERYGLENFEREILEYIDSDEQIQIREQYFLDKFNVSSDPTFYNISGSASGGRTMEGKTEVEKSIWKETCRIAQITRSYKPTTEARKKMSEASKRFWSSLSENERERYRSMKYGNKSNTGLVRTTEEKKKMSAAQIRRFQNPEERLKIAKPMGKNGRAIPISLDGKKYSCKKEACLSLGISRYKLERRPKGDITE